MPSWMTRFILSVVFPVSQNDLAKKSGVNAIVKDVRRPSPSTFLFHPCAPHKVCSTLLQPIVPNLFVRVQAEGFSQSRGCIIIVIRIAIPAKVYASGRLQGHSRPFVCPFDRWELRWFRHSSKTNKLEKKMAEKANIRDLKRLSKTKTSV